MKHKVKDHREGSQMHRLSRWWSKTKGEGMVLVAQAQFWRFTWMQSRGTVQGGFRWRLNGGIFLEVLSGAKNGRLGRRLVAMKEVVSHRRLTLGLMPRRLRSHRLLWLVLGLKLRHSGWGLGWLLWRLRVLWLWTLELSWLRICLMLWLLLGLFRLTIRGAGLLEG